MNNRRNGKVARLPKKIRDTVNQMLEDGHTYKAIVKKLSKLGYPGFNLVNIHTWQIGGFREWHAEQERLSCIRKVTLPLLKTEPAPIAARLASINLASQEICNAFTQFDSDYLGQHLRRHPEHYFSLIYAYHRLLKNRAALEQISQASQFQSKILKILHDLEPKNAS